MKETKFRSLLKGKIRTAALEYLNEKRKSKGKEIIYETLRMADYLLPNSSGLSIADKQEIFSMRNRMTNIPANFRSNKETNKCVCGQDEQMAHIYECKYLNKENITINYENIFEDNVEKMKMILQRFKQNMEKRENIQNLKLKSHETSGPLFSVQCSIVNGIG